MGCTSTTARPSPATFKGHVFVIATWDPTQRTASTEGDFHGENSGSPSVVGKKRTHTWKDDLWPSFDSVEFTIFWAPSKRKQHKRSTPHWSSQWKEEHHGTASYVMQQRSLTSCGLVEAKDLAGEARCQPHGLGVGQLWPELYQFWMSESWWNDKPIIIKITSFKGLNCKKHIMGIPFLTRQYNGTVKKRDIKGPRHRLVLGKDTVKTVGLTMSHEDLGLSYPIQLWLNPQVATHDIPTRKNTSPHSPHH